MVSSFNFKLAAEYLRLKFGDDLEIVQVESEIERATSLIAYKSYPAVNTLNALYHTLMKLSLN